MRFLPAILAITFAIPLCFAQDKKAVPGGTARIRAEAKLVVVDVVVTDENHNRVHGLREQDFRIKEGSVPQTIRSFEEHVPAPAEGSAVRAEVLPPGSFTNRLPKPRSAAVNVILIDLLNTPMRDQIYLGQQLSKYLGSVPAGTELAIFALNSRLVMLQGFDSDPMILKHALDGYRPERSLLLSDAQEENSTPETITDKMTDAGMSKLLMQSSGLANLQNNENRLEAMKTESRTKLTLDGLNSLARYLANLPGRKNLIWFSGAFPISVLPRTPGAYQGNGDYDSFSGVVNSQRELQDTVSLMTRLQVAVYPVDSRGLMVSSAFSSFNRGGDHFAENEDQFMDNIVDEHTTMFQMATDTGGRAFINTNDFVGAVRTAMEDGAAYYTLTYVPTNKKWDGNRRTISVQLPRSGYTLSYRHAYYAQDPNSPFSALVAATPDADGTVHGRLDNSNLTRAMEYGSPGAGEMLYTVSFHPESREVDAITAQSNLLKDAMTAPVHGPYRAFRVDYLLDPGQIVLNRDEKGVYHGLLELAVSVYDRDGKIAASRYRQMEINVTAAQYTRFLGRAVPLREEIAVPLTGRYSIRTGVLDINSGHVGSMEAPVAMLRDLPVIPAEGPDAGSSPTLRTRPNP